METETQGQMITPLPVRKRERHGEGGRSEYGGMMYTATLDEIVGFALISYLFFSGLFFTLHIFFDVVFHFLDDTIRKHFYSRRLLLPSPCCRDCSRYLSCAASPECVRVPHSSYWERIGPFRIH